MVGADGGPTSGGAPGGSPGRAGTAAIIGRADELTALRAWLDGARHGAGRLVLCAGPAGIGKTRLAQELAGTALAGGATVAWGRAVEDEGAPALWPWRQVLGALDLEAALPAVDDVSSAADRFAAFDRVARMLAAGPGRGLAGQAPATRTGATGLLLVLEDLHRADEASLLLLRHLADRLAEAPVLVLATFRDDQPAGRLSGLLPELVRAPAAERLALRGFGLDEVRQRLARAGPDAEALAPAVLDATAGNPFFVGEVARAIAEGSWHPDRPPGTVLDVVGARLAQLSGPARDLLEVAAMVGRDFNLPLVAEVTGLGPGPSLAAVDELAAHALIEPTGPGAHRFVHALTRAAVEASLGSSARLDLHRAVAETLERRGRDPGQAARGPLGDDDAAALARHWTALAPFGEAARARHWTLRAAAEAVHRLAFEEGVELYRAALAFDAPWPDAERAEALLGLGRARHLAGDLAGCSEAALAAAACGRACGRVELVGEAALVLEAASDPAMNAVAKALCDEALAALGLDASAGSPSPDGDPPADAGDPPRAVGARLLAQRAHLAFYDGDVELTDRLSRAALTLARRAGDDRALVAALHARQESCPGRAGRGERVGLAAEMIDVARRLDSARNAMWGHLWRVDALVESGRLDEAAAELQPLGRAVERVGGPVSRWLAGRASACIAQAQGRFDDAAAAGLAAWQLMRAIEPAPAAGSYLALQCALGHHVGMSDEARVLVSVESPSPPLFATMGLLGRAFLLRLAGDEAAAAASYEQAGPPAEWALPGFFTVAGLAVGLWVAIELGRADDVAVLRARLEPHRGEHVLGSAGVVSYLGPVELVLGRASLALGELDAALADLQVAEARAAAIGARAFATEARVHRASALAARGAAGDVAEAGRLLARAEEEVRALGMTAFNGRVAELEARLEAAAASAGGLSAREREVAALLVEGLTNRQIAQRLVISERTAQNHVQHILTKLGFANRSQIAAWQAAQPRRGPDGHRRRADE